MSDPGPELPDPVGPPVSTAPVADRHQPPRWAPLTLLAFFVLLIGTNLANAMWATLVDNETPNPDLLLVLSSRNRYLAGALGAGISIPAFVLIACARISAAFIVCHLIGRAYSHQATGWFKKYLGFTDETEVAFDRGFEKAEWALIPFFAGSNIVAVLTGVRQTPPIKLGVLLAIGIAGRLLLIWWLARFFEDQLDAVLDFTTRYQWWVLGISILSVVLINLRNLRR
ncbi:hypothetical protein [Ilumatobacter nonamiensis]|uniref:hypothetical protein n=1 Tax=Ilumatobacter nonamiensis TaxID=467093 RepID=UPI00034BC36B|nr:hypothetical protein [Ilumatobacter nonamiensis]